MKNSVFFICLLLVGFVAQAQFTVETHDGDPIVDGQILTFGEYNTPNAELPFWVTNTTSSEIKMKIEFLSAVNADGSMMQLCFGLCYTSINLGASYPPNAPITIAAGKHQDSSGDHFINYDSGNGTDVLDYVFKFYQVDNNGNEIGTPLTFTYRYDPNLSIRETKKMDISVYPTVVDEVLAVNSDETLEMNVYNLLGNLVKSIQLPQGKNEVSMADLASQVYLVRFKNENGNTQTKKIIVK